MRGWDGHQDENEDEDEDEDEANEERKEGQTGPKEFLRSFAWTGIGHFRAGQGRAGQSEGKVLYKCDFCRLLRCCRCCRCCCGCYFRHHCHGYCQ